MEENVIVEKLTTIFRSVFKDSSLVLTGNLGKNDIANWDSLAHMILLTEIEKEFEIRFKIKEISSWSNVSQLIEIIQSKF